jgi:hypothetical protein
MTPQTTINRLRSDQVDGPAIERTTCSIETITDLAERVDVAVEVMDYLERTGSLVADAWPRALWRCYRSIPRALLEQGGECPFPVFTGNPRVDMLLAHQWLLRVANTRAHAAPGSGGASMPKRAAKQELIAAREPKIQTIPVSLSKAARWFGIDRRTLAQGITKGTYSGKQLSSNLWVLDLDEVFDANPSAHEPADPCSDMNRGRRKVRQS